MQSDPMEEWRRLTALYSEMGDIEIRDLAAQIHDLTETAQQILRDEMKKRGLKERRSAQEVRSRESEDGDVHWDGTEESSQEIDQDTLQGGAADYTWKTALCRCDSIDEAAQRGEMLRRAGIESWIQRPGARFVVPWLEIGTGDIQLNVAADQLEQARAIMARPVPQDVINQIQEMNAAPDYEIPRCPRCKAEDPVLESIEPSNNWLCESCGFTWSEPVADTAGEGEK